MRTLGRMTLASALVCELMWVYFLLRLAVMGLLRLAGLPAEFPSAEFWAFAAAFAIAVAVVSVWALCERKSRRRLQAANALLSR